MDINKLAGWGLILLAVIMVLQAIMHHLRNLGTAGAFFALVTGGAGHLWRGIDRSPADSVPQEVNG